MTKGDIVSAANHIRMRSLFAGLLAVCLCGCASAPQKPVSDYELEVSDRVVLAGLLDDGIESQLQKSNTVVVDLRTVAEGTADESAQMKRAGISYYNLPVGRSGLTADTREAFRKLLEEHPDQPVVVHCRSGNRAGLLWATHLMDEGATTDEALSSVNDIVTSDGIRKAIRAYHPEDAEK
jgi:uncharacterized protein (TIGR01244 family)